MFGADVVNLRKRECISLSRNCDTLWGNSRAMQWAIRSDGSGLHSIRVFGVKPDRWHPAVWVRFWIVFSAFAQTLTGLWQEFPHSSLQTSFMQILSHGWNCVLVFIVNRKYILLKPSRVKRSENQQRDNRLGGNIIKIQDLLFFTGRRISAKCQATH